MKRILLLIPALFITGCIGSRIHTLTIEPSPSVIRNEPFVVLATVEKKTSNYNFLWVVTITRRPDIDQVIREMISENNGDALIDLRVWKEHQIWLFGSVTIWHIKGKVIRYISR
jgi:hypothetical protein